MLLETVVVFIVGVVLSLVVVVVDVIVGAFVVFVFVLWLLFLSLMFSLFLFLVADTPVYKRLCPSIRPSVTIKSKSVKTCISAPAHPSATGIGRVSGLVYTNFA